METKTEAVMTNYFPVVIEEESNGTFSAWVPGVSVYAAADTKAEAKRAIRSALTAHLATLKSLGRSVEPKGDVMILKGDPDQPKASFQYTGFGSLLGRQTSAAKARAARVNGLRGGRPRKVGHRATAR